MGQRGKIIAEIEREVGRLENRPGLCLFYAHHTASVLWRQRVQGGGPGRLVAVAAGSPRGRRWRDEYAFCL